jgi:hypothetical protein
MIWHQALLQVLLDGAAFGLKLLAPLLGVIRGDNTQMLQPHQGPPLRVWALHVWVLMGPVQRCKPTVLSLTTQRK